MTKEQFDEFIDQYGLYNFDGKIELTFGNGTVHPGVWITTIPSLDESLDGAFAGKQEQEVFYLFDTDNYSVIPVAEIEEVKCLQQNCLKGIPFQLSKFK